MMPERIEIAVNRICGELMSLQSEPCAWNERSEADLFRETVASILGSRVHFEMALAATDALAGEGLLEFCGNEGSYGGRVEAVLSRPLCHPNWSRGRRYRFPKCRARFLAKTATAIYANGGSFKGWLAELGDGRAARRYLVEKASGIGPKQASMILRNIGFCDHIAILDSHLMRFMHLRGLSDHAPRHVASLKRYEEVEARFLDYVERSGWPTPVLDQAIWIVMRVYLKGAMA